MHKVQAAMMHSRKTSQTRPFIIKHTIRRSPTDRLANRSGPQVIELAFSILGSDFAHLADEVAAAERGGGTIVHVDVMDGHFVPNITFGPPIVTALPTVPTLPLHCPLLLQNPH